MPAMHAQEGMMMMGLSELVLYISWYVSYTIQLCLLSVFLTLISGDLFKYSDKSLIFCYYFLFFLSSMAFAFAISAFFSRV
jgi:ATP-binding cassette subfamily A (ABC1) protein 3